MAPGRTVVDRYIEAMAPQFPPGVEKVRAAGLAIIGMFKAVPSISLRDGYLEFLGDLRLRGGFFFFYY